MRGRSDLSPSLSTLPHPAAPLLNRIRRGGAPVVLHDSPWSKEKLDESFLRGPHPSASSPEHLDFLVEECVEFCEAGFFMFLPYDEVRDLPGLRLSPLAVIPQRERKPRLIIDYSYSGINDQTASLAPKQAMQFGQTQQRLIQSQLRANPKFGPVFAAKGDLSDGFYRVNLSPSGSLKLGVVFPTIPGLGRLVGFPLVLPQGHTSSPPWFCAFSETVCDMTNQDLRRNKRFPPHRLEKQAGVGDFGETPFGRCDPFPARPLPASHKALVSQRPLAKVDLFVDDYCCLGQDTPQNPLLNQRRALFHNIDRVFRASDDLDGPSRKEPLSEKKLDKQDASFQTLKRCLGWDHATESRHLLLAPHRRDKALALLRQLLSQHGTNVTTLQQLIGQLRSLVVGLPASEGQFSRLQVALQDAALNHRSRIKIDQTMRSQLSTFVDLLLASETRPITFEEIIPGIAHNLGACDAAKGGAGGVWFTADGRTLVWRLPFPQAIQDDLVSFGNPGGSITNSDLELAGTILHQAVLGDHIHLTGETTHTRCDNNAAVFWRRQGSTTTTTATAKLLRLAANLRRHHRAHHQISHIAGDDNRMADDAKNGLGTMHRPSNLEYRNDLESAARTITAGVSSGRAKAANTAWKTWCTYCRGLSISPDLSNYTGDKVELLIVFACRWRDGRIAPEGHSVKSRTAEDAVRQVGQTFSLLGQRDPRFATHDAKIDFRLTRLWHSWKKQDVPAKRKKPIPRCVLDALTRVAALSATPRDTAMVDLLWLGFFYLLRPSEYLYTGKDAFPFLLDDVFFMITDREYPAGTIPLPLLSAVDRIGLQFRFQKNGIAGEVIWLPKRANDSEPCPVRLGARRIQHLRTHQAVGTTPLHHYFDTAGVQRRINASHVTTALRVQAKALNLTIAVTVGALRCTGATAMLNANISLPLIKLIGRWRSDETFRYFHIQSNVTNGIPASMLQNLR